VASTKLRLLLDESVTDPLARKIQAAVPSAAYVRTNAALKGKDDDDIARFANKDRRAILALDSDYKHLHVQEGVIKMNANRTDEDCLFAIFKMFWRSGFRNKSRCKRAYLTNDGIRITNGVELSHTWHPKPCPHHGGK
jgi:hypothetical protein